MNSMRQPHVDPGKIPRLVHIRPSFGHGGAETRVANIINYTSGLFRHTIVALDGNFAALKLVKDPDAVECLTCLNTRNPAQMIFRLREILRKTNPSLVLTYNWGSIDGAAAAQLMRIPIVHTEDGFDVDEASKQKRRRVLTRRLLLRKVYCVTAPSETLANIMRHSWRLPPEKLRCIPNGVDINLFRPSPREVTNRQLVVGTVGNLTAVKRQSMLLDVCARLANTADIRVVIAGQGPLRQELEERAQQLGIADRVEFLGYQLDVAKVYGKIDIFVLTSATEQMPFSVLEAMACGLPIVSTDVGDIKKMVSRENQPLITHEGKFVDALATLVTDDKLRRQLGQDNREHCVRVYSLDRMCSEYVTLYLDAIGRAKERAVS